MSSTKREAWNSQRKWVTRTAVAVGPLLAIAFVLQVVLSSPMPRWLYILLLTIGGLASFIGGALPLVAAHREEVKYANAERAAAISEVAMLNKVLSYLIPLSSTIESAVSARTSEDKSARKSDLIRSIIDIVQSDFFPNNARACFYSLQTKDDGRRYLACDHYYAGRGDAPRYKFREYRGDGMQVFEKIINKRSSELNSNIEEARFPDWRPEFGFHTYIACAVWSGDKIYGMITIDAVEANSLGENHHKIAILLAQLLGSVMSLC
jgi:hypothetical protein